MPKPAKYKKIPLNKEACDYIKKQLHGGKSFSYYLLDCLKNFSGKPYTFMPDSVITKDLPFDNFRCQILSLTKEKSELIISKKENYEVRAIPQDNKSTLAEIIKKDLKDGKVFIFEENLASRNDPFLQNSLIKMDVHFLFSNEKTYYSLGKEDAMEKIKKTIQIAYNFYPGLIAALTSLPKRENIDRKNHKITEKQLKVLAERTEKIILSAYDGEGYLIWERKSGVIK